MTLTFWHACKGKWAALPGAAVLQYAYVLGSTSSRLECTRGMHAPASAVKLSRASPGSPCAGAACSGSLGAGDLPAWVRASSSAMACPSAICTSVTRPPRRRSCQISWTHWGPPSQAPHRSSTQRRMLPQSAPSMPAAILRRHCDQSRPTRPRPLTRCLMHDQRIPHHHDTARLPAAVLQRPLKVASEQPNAAGDHLNISYQNGSAASAYVQPGG